MANKISCTKLATTVLTLTEETLGFDPKVITKLFETPEGLAKDFRKNCETYGSKTCLYIDCVSNENRKKFERWLSKNKIGFNGDYWAGSGTCEVHVSYFKSYGWDL